MSERGFTLEPAPIVAGLRAYSPPRTGTPLDLHLDGNEGAGPPAELLEAMTRGWPESVRRYPDTRPLEARLAASVGVPPEQVLVTAGGDDALERILRATLCAGRELILPVPTFEMIERYARLAGAEVTHVPWSEGSYPVEPVLKSVTDRTAVITVVSPNSPTGIAATAEELARLSEGAPHCLILVDLAYVEFCDEDLTAAALSLPNAVAVRSMSKAWGIAGARVGWAAGPPRLIEWLRAVGHPYAVSAPSLALAEARLEAGADGVAPFIARVRQERQELTAVLRRLGADCPPSQANFLLGRFRDAPWVRDGLAGLGIGVRIFPGKPDLDGCLRITLPGGELPFERLRRGIETLLAPEAVLVTARCASAEEEALEGLRSSVAVGVVPSAEDGSEGEPSPLPPALDSLGVERAWLVGDQPREMEWARAVGIVPIGWVPGADGVRGEELIRAGAGRTVRSLTEIQELTP